MQAECLKLHTNSHRDCISERFELALAEALADARDRSTSDCDHPEMVTVANR
jgi:hypothetical protein